MKRECKPLAILVLTVSILFLAVTSYAAGEKVIK